LNGSTTASHEVIGVYIPETATWEGCHGEVEKGKKEL